MFVFFPSVSVFVPFAWPCTHLNFYTVLLANSQITYLYAYVCMQVCMYSMHARIPTSVSLGVRACVCVCVVGDCLCARMLA